MEAPFPFEEKRSHGSEEHFPSLGSDAHPAQEGKEGDFLCRSIGAMVAVSVGVWLAAMALFGAAVRFYPPLLSWVFGTKGQALQSSYVSQPALLPPVSASSTPHEAQIVAVVQHALPAVVSVIGETKEDENALPSTPLPFPFLPYPPSIKEGSGFFVGVRNGKGIILTNRHVVDEEQASYTVITSTSERVEVTRIWRDPFLDLAFLEVPVAPPATLSLGSSEQLQLGQTVVAIGNALGRFTNSVSVGVLSGKGRSLVASGEWKAEMLEAALQTDAAINPGNSGGPLLDLTGKVVGINVAVASGAQNIGFAIPAEMAAPALHSILQEGEIVRPWLGVRYRMITPELVEANNLPVKEGALIIRGATPKDLAVIPGSPADKAGIEENDIIRKVNGIPVTRSSPLGFLIRRFAPGDTITLELLHDGKQRTVQVTLEKAPTSLAK